MTFRPAVLLCAVVVVVGCGRDRVSAVRPQLVVPETNRDFGSVPVLNPKKLTIPVKNLGRATLTVSNVQLSQGPEGVFQLGALPTSVSGADEQVIEVTFLPSLEQPYTAVVSFDTNDEDAPHVQVTLQGQGSTRAIAEVMPAMVDFGRVGECTFTLSTVTLFSKGTADLIVDGIAFGDGTSPAFSFVGSTKTPVTVKVVGDDGLPGQLQLTVKYTVPKGAAAGEARGSIVFQTTDPDRRQLVVPLVARPNLAPIAKIKPFEKNGAPGALVEIDGTESTDPDGDLPLVFKWLLKSKPLASTTMLSAVDSALTSMVLDPAVPGTYDIQLDVTDHSGVKACEPALASVVARPAEKLLVEVFWNHAVTDVDLHVLRTPESVVGELPDDCFFGNRRPDWGLPGPTDDPNFQRDALTGYGPERFGYVDPITSTFRLVVELANDNLDANPATEVTIRAYVFGVLQMEQRKTLSTKNELWQVADIEWPSGKISKL